MLGRGLGRLAEVILAETPEASRNELRPIALVHVVAIPLAIFWPQHLKHEHGVVQAVPEVLDCEELEHLRALIEDLHHSVGGHVSTGFLHEHFREIEDEGGQNVEEVEEESVSIAASQLDVRLPDDPIARIQRRTVVQCFAEVRHGDGIPLS